MKFQTETLPINRYRITTALFLGVLGYVPLWGQNLDFTPDRPDGSAKIQSALWELAMPGAAKPVRDLTGYCSRHLGSTSWPSVGFD